MKKLLALCLTVMLVLAMVPVIGAAAADTAVFAANNVEGAAGEEVTVTVSIDANPGLTFAQVLIGYDADALEVVNIESLTFAGKPTTSSPTTSNPLKVTYDNGLKNITDVGALANITFKIKDGAAAGEYTLAVTADQANIFDTAYNDVPFTTTNGSIKVVCKHTETETKNAKEATCSAEGYTGDEVCSACGETVKTGTAIAKTAHTEVVEGKVEATCSAVGSTGTTKCSVCGEVTKEAEEIAKKPHTEVVEGKVEATCTEAGSTGTTKCSVCGEVTKEATVIDALGHDTEIVGAKDATCEAAGYTGDEVCKVCGETVKAGEEIAQLAHDWKEVDKKDATCAEEGMEAHYACANGCNGLAADAEGAEAVKAEDLVIEKLAHTLSKVAGVAATTEKTGVKEHYACSECEQLFADAEGKTVVKAEDTVIPKIEKAPENSDNSDKAPVTSDVVNFIVVATMLMAIAAAAVVVLKKKA